MRVSMLCRYAQDATEADGKRAHVPGVYYELHFDGHEKLNFKAFADGPCWYRYLWLALSLKQQNGHVFGRPKCALLFKGWTLLS
jgi:hypothetical protein